MANTITLPDHISFEEIALKWCEVLDGLNVLPSTGITFVRFEENIVNHFVEYDCITDEGHVGQSLIADYCPSDRKIRIRDEEKFQSILDFIKERSNSYHEITIPDNISLEQIARIWCHKDLRNSVIHSCMSWVFVQFGDDSYKIAAKSSSNWRTLKFYPEFVPSASAFMDHVVSFIGEDRHG